ncbi:MAG TPA: TetR family transcriptional regulator [Mycobacterium sp.]|nr:TetR family transcriptional regulator [Mycobacterium sp.]
MADARPPSAHRRIAIADAVIEVLAAKGSRGTTHRAVDQHLGFPEGSTSAYFRTRASLLAAAAHRAAELDREALQGFLTEANQGDVIGLAALITAVVDAWTTADVAPRQLARFELHLEALRNPELANVFVELRSSFVKLAETALATAGGSVTAPADSSTLAGALIALVDGLIVDRLLHPRTALPVEHLSEAVAHLLASNA